MLDDVAEAAVEGHQHAAFARRNRKHSFIGDTRQLLVPSKRHIVTTLAENHPNRVRNILVELDGGYGYAAGIGTMVSRARSAAYANAADTASRGSVG